MKADPLRLASVFYEAGMIDDATFTQCRKTYEPNGQSIWEALNESVSAKSIYNLMTAEIDMPFSGKRKEQSIHAALSHPVQMGNGEILTLLSALRPPIRTLLDHLHGASSLPEPAETVLLSLGKRGDESYRQLIERGYLSARNLNQIVLSLPESLCKANRLLLALTLLSAHGILPEAECEKVAERYARKGEKTIPRLDTQILEFIEAQPEVPEVNPDEIAPPDSLLKAFPSALARQNLFLPLRRSHGAIEIVASDPFHVMLADTLTLLSGVPVALRYTPASALIERIEALYPDVSRKAAAQPRDSTGEIARAVAVAPAALADSIVDTNSAVEIVGSIVDSGVRHSATDIHLEPHDGNLRVRYRVDGRLRHVMDLPSRLAPSIVNRLKVLASLNVTERRRPQDGHFSLRIDLGTYDFRVSSLPTHIGEKIVIRILDESRVMHNLESLGMEPDQSRIVRKWIARPHGLVLVTGPTGSGKSSTLYAALHIINNEEKNVVTIENPVEYRLDGINQVQVDAAFDLNFANGLRSILRQDPDVIMVGEIRDPETAVIAMRASLTGHLVLSTLHANSAVGIVAALGQMGVEPFMIVSALTGVISQRLVRILCSECRRRFEPQEALLRSLNMEASSIEHFYEAVGCPACLGIGYRGRTGVYELMPLNEPLSEAILARRSEAELTALLRGSGFASLLTNATRKLGQGITSPQEIIETLISEE